jgi:hypothetical protein
MLNNKYDDVIHYRLLEEKEEKNQNNSIKKKNSNLFRFRNKTTYKKNFDI